MDTNTNPKNDSRSTRRDFAKLIAIALASVTAGTLLTGCKIHDDDRHYSVDKHGCHSHHDDDHHGHHGCH